MRLSTVVFVGAVILAVVAALGGDLAHWLEWTLALVAGGLALQSAGQ